MKNRSNAEKPGRFKAALLGWLGVDWRTLDSTVPASTDTAGQNITPNSVMTLSAAWACTRLISESIGTLPLQLYERTDGGRRLATEHPLYRILHSSPNANATPSTYWEAKSAALLNQGNGLSEKQILNGRLVGLKFLAPNRLTRRRMANGQYQFFYTEDNGQQRPVRNSRLFHVPGFSLDGQWGVSAISYGARVFGSALAASQAANSTFEKGLQPSVYLKMERVLKKEQRADFRESLKEIRGSIQAGNSPLLEGGMDAEAIGINPKDAQLLESRAFSVEEVCRWYLVDPSMVGHGNKDSNWGTGLEQKMLRFITFTLRPWLTRIEQAINKSLLPPQDQGRYYAEFSIEGLLRGDAAARAALYSVMVNNGIWSRDEVREKENMPARGGNADVLTVQSAMVPLDLIGTQTDGDTARAALKAWLDEADDAAHKQEPLQ